MTADELATYYADLLIMQYKEKPKAYAQVLALAKMAVRDLLPIQIQDAFSLDTAIGVQLDVLGKYVGVSRVGYGTDGHSITLDDDDYRSLQRLVIIKNNGGSSLATIQALLSAHFPGQIFVSDNRSMGLNYVLVESLGTSDLLELIVTGGYLPRPMGVEVSATVVPEHANPFFGFRTAEAADPTVAPFNTAEFYQTNCPWLDATGVA
jgi:hypothetical protein